jgi:hypothetical protein
MIFDPQKRARRRRGTTLVETAIALNLFLLLVLGVFEFGRLLMARHLINNAARGAARLASSGTANKTEAIIKQAALDLVAGQFSPVPVVLVYKADANGNNIGLWDDAGFGQGIAVQVDLDYRPLLPTFGIVPSTVHLRSKSIMRSEGD